MIRWLRIEERTARVTVIALFVLTAAASIFVTQHRAQRQDARDHALDRREARVEERERIIERDRLVLTPGPSSDPIVIVLPVPTSTPRTTTVTVRSPPPVPTSAPLPEPALPPPATLPTTTVPRICELPLLCELVSTDRPTTRSASTPLRVTGVGAWMLAAAVLVRHSREEKR